MTYRAGILGLVLVLMPLNLRAETIILNSGKTIQGKIVTQSKDAIVLDTGVENMAVTYYRDEIKSILSDEDAPDKSISVDKLENQAVIAIDNGDVDKGLALMAQVIQMDPTPSRHMNYASILFGNGVAAFKNGQGEQSFAILHQSEAELNKAIKDFDKDRDAINLSQCYFLLGEMYLNAFNDTIKAKEFYTKSVSFYDHPVARAALAKLEAK